MFGLRIQRHISQSEIALRAIFSKANKQDGGKSNHKQEQLLRSQLSTLDVQAAAAAGAL